MNASLLYGKNDLKTKKNEKKQCCMAIKLHVQLKFKGIKYY